MTVADLLLEFFDQRGYTELEVVVGENLSEVYRRDLEQKGVAIYCKHASIDNGKLSESLHHNPQLERA